MKFLDKIALNRLIAIITSFILGLIKIFTPDKTDPILPPKRSILDRLRKIKRK
jgi:hypothetical protein